ncbi:MAG TPA: hypothetical protein VK184_26975, partial [Nostocaceae cyanobacterium]|nr:hypothetical protein [Nostocaceae cyanobacterium]
MSALATVVDQIRNEIQIDEFGVGKATMRATARLIDVSDVAILKALSGANLNPSKMAQSLIEQGFDAANLESWKTEGIPDIAIAIIAHYYAYEAGRYCTEQAKLVCKAFTAVGIRAWMQDITGWSRQKSNTPLV